MRVCRWGGWRDALRWLLPVLVASVVIPAAGPTRAAEPADGLQNVAIVDQVGGQLGTLAVEGSRLYASVGPRLALFDLSSPDQPRLVGRSAPLLGRVRRIVAADRWVYAAVSGSAAQGTSGLRIFDVADSGDPREVGRLDLPNAEEVDVAVAGHYAFLTGEPRPGAAGGLRVVDVADPTQPVEVAALGTAALTILQERGVAYVAGLGIVDIHDPLHPRRIGTFVPSGLAAADGHYLYQVSYPSASTRGGGTLETWDVANPTRPVRVRTAPVPEGVGSVAVRVGVAYVTYTASYLPYSGGPPPVGLLVLPATPAATAISATLPLPDTAGPLALAGPIAYVAGGSTVHAVDVANPAQPVRIGGYDLAWADTPLRVALGDGQVYATTASRRVAAFAPDAAGHLQFTGAYATHDPPGADRFPVAAVGGAVYAGARRDLQVLDLAEPSQPRALATLDWPVAEVVQVGSLAYVAGGGLHVLDVTDPAAPVEVGALDLPAGSVAVAGSLAFVTAGDTLRVVDVTDPTAPVERGSYSVAYGGLGRVQAQGTTVYALAGGTPGRLVVLDASDPDNLTELGVYAVLTPRIQAPLVDLAVSGTHAYVAGGLMGLRVFDVSDPARVVEVGHLETLGEAVGVAVVGDAAWVADTAAGLWVVHFTGAAPELPPGALLHDQRYFALTGYRVDEDAIWAYYQARGGFAAFGLPVSRTFDFLGCRAQIFQRQIAQLCPGQSPGLMNLLDPDLFPYTQVNGSTFPAPDPALKASTPAPDDPAYASAILDFVRSHAPDVWEGEPVKFGQTFFSLVTPAEVGTDDPAVLGLANLELWGAPTSQPQRDPRNASFIYQRFQRGIMHYTAGRGQTVGILLGDYVKQILRGGDELPPDLRAQAQHSRFFGQYCPSNPGWLCRPQELPGTDFTRAFERG